MGKIYGYKDADAQKFAEFLKKHKGTLSSAFEEFGRSSEKSKGTVRNMYYAMVKKAESDEKFCREYFGKNPPTVKKNEKFTEEESRELLIKILRYKAEGKSVRFAVNFLANGDGAKALRYQNKYRALMKGKNGKDQPIRVFKRIQDDELSKLKEGIDGLVGRISEKAEKENRSLKARLEYLEKENLRLCNILYGGYTDKAGGGGRQS